MTARFAPTALALLAFALGTPPSITPATAQTRTAQCTAALAAWDAVMAPQSKVIPGALQGRAMMTSSMTLGLLSKKNESLFSQFLDAYREGGAVMAACPQAQWPDLLKPGGLRSLINAAAGEGDGSRDICPIPPKPGTAGTDENSFGSWMLNEARIARQNLNQSVVAEITGKTDAAALPISTLQNDNRFLINAATQWSEKCAFSFGPTRRPDYVVRDLQDWTITLDSAPKFVQCGKDTRAVGAASQSLRTLLRDKAMTEPALRTAYGTFQAASEKAVPACRIAPQGLGEVLPIIDLTQTEVLVVTGAPACKTSAQALLGALEAMRTATSKEATGEAISRAEAAGNAAKTACNDDAPKRLADVEVARGKQALLQKR